LGERIVACEGDAARAIKLATTSAPVDPESMGVVSCIGRAEGDVVCIGDCE
jgi:hypothetical protein